MRISNEPGEPTGPSGAFAELFRLQSDFHARLAEETLRYLRRLQGAVVPVAPSTVVLPSDGLELHGEGAPGGETMLAVEIENLQRVHCMVTPQLTPLVSTSGVTWFPVVESAPGSRLVAPGAVERLEISLPMPEQLPPGEYRGALLLQGFRKNSLPVVVTVRGEEPPPTEERAAKSGPKKRASPAKKSARKRRPS
jgi:hypothetical protein